MSEALEMYMSPRSWLPIHQMSDSRKLPIMEPRPMDRERATMKAATATPVRPRFWMMLPAAIRPGSFPMPPSRRRSSGWASTMMTPVSRLSPKRNPKTPI